jgi:hypothetical protein
MVKKTCLDPFVVDYFQPLHVTAGQLLSYKLLPRDLSKKFINADIDILTRVSDPDSLIPDLDLSL